jgi:hypothetical protein
VCRESVLYLRLADEIVLGMNGLANVVAGVGVVDIVDAVAVDGFGCAGGCFEA